MFGICVVTKIRSKKHVQSIIENAVLQRDYIIESVLQLSIFMSEGPDRDGVTASARLELTNI